MDLLTDALEEAARGCAATADNDACTHVLEGALHLIRAIAARGVYVQLAPEGASMAAPHLLTHPALTALARSRAPPLCAAAHQPADRARRARRASQTE